MTQALRLDGDHGHYKVIPHKLRIEYKKWFFTQE